MRSEPGRAATELRGWRGVRHAFATPAALTLALLGFGCGLPFLLVGATLAAWLRESGWSLAAIGVFSFVGFAYVLKFLWAPLVDRYPLPFLGRRRGWLAAAQLALIAALLALARQDPATARDALVLLVGLAAFAGATQDTVVDAYRIEVAPREAQAALAATYTLGYRLGLILSGAGALYLAELAGWRTAYEAAALLLLVPLAATLLAREPDAAAAAEIRRVDPVDAFVAPVREFFRRRGGLLALALLGFVGLFKFPDQMIGVLANPFYLDSGYGKADIATVSKLYGVWVGVAGAFLGGACVAVHGIRPLLLVAAIAVAASNLAYLLMAAYPGATWAFVAAISADNLAQGFAGTVLVAFMSGLTDPRYTATQYALLVSLANLPGKVVGGVSGFIVEASSYQAFFAMSAASVVPTLLLLAWLWPRLESREAAW